ncbi:glycosyltransferase family 2 protein [Altererythrobacter sp. SALINAS58]|uniref:glycosyltransferase family 2 protein n=1 Tax=Alteripontixanthobacter muriae TaxID=2705546 RepID=UPI0015772CC6|nr:glycosyltransferase family A protein [Alteripontixanthobacter muriae]NTZ42337.1 glycosyltransferase family 2 protein [Alteripontixanthobacter muriae]
MTAATGPRVSVVMIFLNSERYIAEAIESVLAQDLRDFELIMVDDGSTDGSTALTRGYAKQYPDRCFYLEHPGHANRGMSASRNAGVRLARASLLSFIDGDDVWPQSKLREQLEILDAHPEIGMVAGAACYWRSWQGGEDECVPGGHIQDQPVPPGAATTAVYPLGAAQAPCMSIMIRREVLERVGASEDSFTGMYEDQALLAKVYLETSVWFSSRRWLFYRQHDMSCMAESERCGTYHVARKRFLDWFETYLVQRAVSDPAIWVAIRKAQFPYQHPCLAAVQARAAKLSHLLRRAVGKVRRAF